MRDEIAALWLSYLSNGFQDDGSQIITELQGWSEPETKYNWFRISTVLRQHILAL